MEVLLFILPIVFFFALYRLLMLIIVSRMNHHAWNRSEALRWESAARAGGHGMVYTKEGGVQNAVSAEECQRRADQYKK